MKKFLNILALALFILALTSCGSTKKGCGLTSDAEKIEHNTTIKETTTVLATR